MNLHRSRGDVIFCLLFVVGAAWFTREALRGFWMCWVIAAYNLAMFAIFVRPQTAVPKLVAIAPTAQPPLTVIEPVDESDPFCTCPKCFLLGTHGLKFEQSTRELVFLEDDRAGNRTAMWKHSAGLEVPDGSWLVVRQCWSCQHEWKTLTDQPKGTA